MATESNANLPELLTIPEAARFLRCNVSTIYRSIKMGKIRPTKITGRTLISADELRRLIEAHTAPSAT